MASKGFLFAVIVVAAAAAPAFAVDYFVGDEYGWSLGVNYTAWAQGKMFYVGDTIAFKYTVGDHNVYKVNGTAFQQCSVPPPSEALRTGNDIITLATPERKWYLSGGGNGTDCANGMKLVITVVSAAPTPAPSPSPWPVYRAPTRKPMSVWSNWKLKFHF